MKTTRTTVCVLVIGVLGTLLCGPRLASGLSYELKGFVREGDIKTGAGLANTKVCIDRLNLCVYTDDRGLYLIDELPFGTYQVRAERSRYEPAICSTETTAATTWCSMAMNEGGGPASNSFAKAQPREQYEMVREALKTLFTPEFDELYGPADTDGDGVLYYDLEDCNSGTAYIPSYAAPLIDAYAEMGYRANVLRRYLPRLGYPESLWEPYVSKFESDGLALILRTNGRSRPYIEFHADDDGYGIVYDALGPEFDRYRAEHPGTGVVMGHTSCGEGMEDLAVHTDPPGGRVLIIPTFFHDLCRVQGLDPDDASQCDRWREPIDGKLSYIAGTYFYRVTWPDGTTRKGRIEPGDYWEEASVTFRR